MDDDAARLDVCLDLQAARDRLIVVGRNLPGFDVRFDFHTLSFSLWMLTLNIERRRHLLGFEAGNGANLYNRKRDGESLTRRKNIFADKKPGL